MRQCPSCGASNAESATWCSLCLARFDLLEGGVTGRTKPPGSADAGGARTEALHSTHPPELSTSAQTAITAATTSSVRVEVTPSGIALPSIDADPGAAGPTQEGAPPLAFQGESTAQGLPLAPVGAQGVRGSHAHPADLVAHGGSGAHPTFVQRPSPVVRPTVPLTGRASLPIRVERDQTGRLIQRCNYCDAVNPIEANECSVCGADFFAALREPEEEKRVEPTKALIWGLIPGGGFLAMGKRARFVGHLALVLWLIGLSLMLFKLSPRTLFLFKATFAFMAAGVWAASAIDANRRASGVEETLLTGKRPLMVFAASIALLFVLAFVVTWSAAQQRSRQAPDGIQVTDVPPTEAAAVGFRGWPSDLPS